MLKIVTVTCPISDTNSAVNHSWITVEIKSHDTPTYKCLWCHGLHTYNEGTVLEQVI